MEAIENKTLLLFLLFYCPFCTVFFFRPRQLSCFEVAFLFFSKQEQKQTATDLPEKIN